MKLKHTLLGMSTAVDPGGPEQHQRFRPFRIWMGEEPSWWKSDATIAVMTYVYEGCGHRRRGRQCQNILNNKITEVLPHCETLSCQSFFSPSAKRYCSPSPSSVSAFLRHVALSFFFPSFSALK